MAIKFGTENKMNHLFQRITTYFFRVADLWLVLPVLCDNFYSADDGFFGWA